MNQQHQQAQAQIRITIQDMLDDLLPKTYTAEIYEQKCEIVYHHVYENYYGEGRSTYRALPLAGRIAFPVDDGGGHYDVWVVELPAGVENLFWCRPGRVSPTSLKTGDCWSKLKLTT